jgi:biopolymer transport protein ExbD
MAGGANLGDDDQGITDINVTPLVDVMLVLLIIFMVTANYIANQAINLNLPKAATGETPGDTNLGFSINAESEFFLDGEPVSLDQLPALIEQRREENPRLQALIAADEQTPHGSVVKLIDIIRKNGITDFAINVEVEAQE